MSHQVLLTFDIDEAKVQENAEQSAGRKIADTVLEKAFGRNYDYMPSYQAQRIADEIIQKTVDKIIGEHKSEIIEKAVKNVTANLHRTKAVKELLEKETGQ